MAKRRIGNIEFRDGRWRARMRVNGKMEIIGRFATEQEADEAINMFARTLAIRSPFVGVTLREYGQLWLDERELNGVHRAVKDARSVWASRIDTAKFAGLPLVAITPQDVREWVKGQLRTPNARGVRPARQTVMNALNLLRVALADALDEGRIESNPAREARVPKVATTKDKWTWLREPELKALLTSAAVPEERRDLFTFAIYTGMRAGEIFGLLWEDFDKHRGTISIRHSWLGKPTKKGHIREQHLFAPAYEAITRQRARSKGCANVWPADDCEPHTKGYDGDLGKWLRAASITRHVRFHDLRHTCASHLVSGTWGRPWSLPEVAGWLGHISILSTQRYAHLSPAGLHRAFTETPISRRAQ